MSVWLIIPRDPLVFRDGKPFTATPGERAKSLAFPFPSTLAGAVRTRMGIDSSTNQFDSNRIKELLEQQILGPILAALDNEGKVKQEGWFFPAPADALLVEQDGKVKRFYLAPLSTPTGARTNLDGMSLVGPSEVVKDKPLAHPPLYWTWDQIQAWLENPQDDLISIDILGIQGPVRENRTHVSIDGGTQTAFSGALFQTSGMEFVQLARKGNETIKLSKACSLSLALEIDANLSEGLGFLGGERRIVYWQKTGAHFPHCPDEIRNKIIQQKSCRLMLVSPAYFKNGFLPIWLKENYHCNVKAIALPRYQTVSGWDYDKKQPKPTRRLASVGSVYFIEFSPGADIGKFIDDVWMHPISDDLQSRRDSFGLSLLGTWDGKSRTMEVRHE